mgnify:CR=1 FL=1
MLVNGAARTVQVHGARDVAAEQFERADVERAAEPELVARAQVGRNPIAVQRNERVGEVAES